MYLEQKFIVSLKRVLVIMAFADLPLESSELLLNTTEGTGLERTGYFTDQKDINKFWEVSQSSVGVTGAPSASVLSYDIDTDGMLIYISGSTLDK